MDTNTPKILKDEQISDLHELIEKVSYRQKRDFGNINTDLKPDGTLITECDRWSDKTIVEGLSIISKDEGVLSEEGSKKLPHTKAFWVVDPLDGTTNFSAGIPYWAISIARFVDKKPQTAFLDIPALGKRIIAIQGKGVWLNGKRIDNNKKKAAQSECVSLCSRSIRILQQKPNQTFPGKIRLLGVSSLNMISVGLGQTIAAIEATPKIWDIGAAWLVLQELGCPIKWLEANPSEFSSGKDLSSVNFPLVTANNEENINKFFPWSKLLLNNNQGKGVPFR